MSNLKSICITSGDTDGIGLEVSLKALLKIGQQKRETAGLRFILFHGNQLGRADQALLKKVTSRFKPQIFSSLDEVLNQERPHAGLCLIQSSLAPARWVELSAEACLSQKVQAMCTAPLSKPGIMASGLKDLGHTEILKRICGVEQANMCFIGKKFNVVLVTGHLPLEKVPDRLTAEQITRGIHLADAMRSHLPAAIRRKPLGVLGLNPHAGDQGLIGRFEVDTLSPLLERLNQSGIKTSKPLIPDVAFQPKNWKNFSFYVALYHDQGLIPFKLAHGFDSGVHLTLGLPICRTSVDHGTAKDIYGKGLADSGSMKDALLWSIKMAKARAGKENQYV